MGAGNGPNTGGTIDGGAEVRRTVVGSLVGAAMLALAGCGGTTVAAQAAAHTTARGTITVLGSGQAAVPLVGASFSAGIQRQAQTASAALAAANQGTHTLIAALEHHGVAAKDLTTTQLTVNPRYAYPKGQPPRLVGFQASDTLRVKVASASRAGPLIDTVVAAGATDINAISFGPSHRTGLTARAVAAAVADARVRASAVARAAHLTLGPIVTVTMRPPSQPARTMAFEPMAAAAQRTPILTGTQKVRAEVRVTFATARG